MTETPALTRTARPRIQPDRVAGPAAQTVRASAEWLALREPADAAARSRPLVALLPPPDPAAAIRVVHDLGSGTGGMPRWLAPLLPGPQHWVLHDRDADLLAVAATTPDPRTADHHHVTVETRRDDVTRLSPADLAGADLITASALLDMLTAPELERLVATCVAAGAPTLVALSVVGRVDLTPPDPLDRLLEGAFNAHQRRIIADDPLLGPDAAPVAIRLWENAGWQVTGHPTPWHLDCTQPYLTREWLDGWIGAAVEWRQDLGKAGAAYGARRRAQLAAGRLRATVHHVDLLATPPRLGGMPHG